jgi:hypothetical protein
LQSLWEPEAIQPANEDSDLKLARELQLLEYQTVATPGLKPTEDNFDLTHSKNETLEDTLGESAGIPSGIVSKHTLHPAMRNRAIGRVDREKLEKERLARASKGEPVGINNLSDHDWTNETRDRERYAKKFKRSYDIHDIAERGISDQSSSVYVGFHCGNCQNPCQSLSQGLCSDCWGCGLNCP